MAVCNFIDNVVDEYNLRGMVDDRATKLDDREKAAADRKVATNNNDDMMIDK